MKRSKPNAALYIDADTKHPQGLLIYHQTAQKTATPNINVVLQKVGGKVIDQH
jgi:hypothetical protein